MRKSSKKLIMFKFFPTKRKIFSFTISKQNSSNMTMLPNCRKVMCYRTTTKSYLEHILHFFSFGWVIPRTRVDLVDVTTATAEAISTNSNCK